MLTFQSSGGIMKNVSLQGTKMFQITFRRWWRCKDVLSCIILGYRQAVRHWTLTPAFRRFESYYPSQIRTQSQNDLWVLFFVMCFFEVKINLIFSQLWQDAADKIARRSWRAIFLSILGDENVSVSFRLAGVGANIRSGLFLFVADTRNRDQFYVFLIASSGCREKGGRLCCFFYFRFKKNTAFLFGHS